MIVNPDANSEGSGGEWLEIVMTEPAAQTRAGGGISNYYQVTFPVKSSPYAIVIMPVEDGGNVSAGSLLAKNSNGQFVVAGKVNISNPDLAFVVDNINISDDSVTMRVGYDSIFFQNIVYAYVIYEQI